MEHKDTLSRGGAGSNPFLPSSPYLDFMRPILLGFALAALAAVTWWLVRVLLATANLCVSDIVGLSAEVDFEAVAFLVGTVILAPLGESYVLVQVVEWSLKKSHWPMMSLAAVGAAFVLVHAPFRTCLDFVPPLLVAFCGNVAYIAARLPSATRRTTWLEVSILHGAYNLAAIAGVSAL